MLRRIETEKSVAPTHSSARSSEWYTLLLTHYTHNNTRVYDVLAESMAKVFVIILFSSTFLLKLCSCKEPVYPHGNTTTFTGSGTVILNLGDKMLNGKCEFLYIKYIKLCVCFVPIYQLLSQEMVIRVWEWSMKHFLHQYLQFQRK